jgi:hypothetical protein
MIYEQSGTGAHKFRPLNRGFRAATRVDSKHILVAKPWIRTSILALCDVFVPSAFADGNCQSTFESWVRRLSSLVVASGGKQALITVRSRYPGVDFRREPFLIFTTRIAQRLQLNTNRGVDHRGIKVLAVKWQP